MLDVNLDYSTALLVEKHIHGITLPEAHSSPEPLAAIRDGAVYPSDWMVLSTAAISVCVCLCMPAGKQHEGIAAYIMRSANTIIINMPILISARLGSGLGGGPKP